MSVGEKGGARQCSFCRDAKLRGPLMGCPGCGTIVHQECWEANKGCPTPACGRSIKVGVQVPARPPETPVPAVVGASESTTLLTGVRWETRLARWWHDAVSRHHTFASLEWKFVTRLVQYVTGAVCAITVISMVWAFVHDKYVLHNYWPWFGFTVAMFAISALFCHLHDEA